jgi:hypothetical protein
MAGGIKGLSKIQIGAEGTAGTAVPATTVMRSAFAAPDDQRPLTFPTEDIGYLSGVDRSYIPYLAGRLAIPAREATFEQLPYTLAAGIKNVVTGVADGVGAGKIYAYPLPLLSANTIKTYTIESGDNQQAEEMEYAFVSEFTIAGETQGALMVNDTWQGRQWTPAAFTGALSAPEVEPILFQKGKLYIDAVGGTLGNTLISSTLMGMTLSVKTGWVANFTGDGELYFTNIEHVADQMEVLLNITFRHNATAVTEKANWRAQTPRQLRLAFQGSALAAGTTYSAKTFQIDLAGKWERFEPLSERNGMMISTGIFRARYNATADLFANLTVVNALASLP